MISKKPPSSWLRTTKKLIISLKNDEQEAGCIAKKELLHMAKILDQQKIEIDHFKKHGWN